MATSVSAPKTSRLTVNIYDGTRQLMPAGTETLITIFDGNRKQLHRDFHGLPAVAFDLPFYDNLGDNFTVIASAKGYHQAGFTPVKCSPAVSQRLDLMLIRKNASFSFKDARWQKLKTTRPDLYSLLSTGAESEEAARDRYTQLLEKRPAALAALLNITTGMAAIFLPDGSPMKYLKEVLWDESLQQDRFFAYADRELLNQVRIAAGQGLFQKEEGSFIFHPGATESYKQVQFGEANVQLTFHETDAKVIDGVSCIKIEPDIDYYRDLGAHALLEVMVNGITGSITDPAQVYVLRWMAGRRAGIPEFDPLYTIA